MLLKVHIFVEFLKRTVVIAVTQFADNFLMAENIGEQISFQ